MIKVRRKLVDKLTGAITISEAGALEITPTDVIDPKYFTTFDIYHLVEYSDDSCDLIGRLDNSPFLQYNFITRKKIKIWAG